MNVLFQRHYVSKPEHVKSLEGVVDRTIEASKIIRDDALLGISVAYKPNLDDSIYFDVCKQLSRLKGYTFTNILEQSTEIPRTSYNGAGTGLSSMLFNSLIFKTIDKEEPVIITMDGDQYLINDVDLIEASKELSKRLKNNKTVLGLGARTHIKMSANLEMDKLRKLHEMFQSYMSYPMLDLSNPNPRNLDLSDVPICYKELKESTPGFYAVNHDSPLMAEVINDFKESAKKANLRGFAFDYYLTLLVASKNHKIEYVYVPTNSGHPNIRRSREAIEKLIIEQTHEVLQTNIRDLYLKNIQSEDTIEAISNYFDINDVRYVQNLMMSSSSL